MTVCEATEELLKYYKENDVFVLGKDLSTVLLISEDENAELAAIQAALKDLEEHKVISSQEVGETKYFVLNKSLQTMSQDLELDLDTANLIAGSINQSCTKTETFDNEADPLNLTVKDLRTLAFMSNFLLDSDKKTDDDLGQL